MRKIAALTAAALLVAGAGPVLAQGAVVELSPDQQTEVIQDFSGADVQPVPDANFDVSVGAAVPHDIELHAVPDKIIKVVPAYSNDEYFRLADGRIVIVEPDSSKIIAVLH